jgi:hypothetical protein
MHLKFLVFSVAVRNFLTVLESSTIRIVSMAPRLFLLVPESARKWTSLNAREMLCRDSDGR